MAAPVPHRGRDRNWVVVPAPDQVGAALHHNLKSGNILLDRNNVSKVAVVRLTCIVLLSVINTTMQY
jgi:hypothetical protein